MSARNKRLASGKWDGFYMHAGSRNALLLELRFADDGSISGNCHDVNSIFTVAGTYNASPPYQATLALALLDGTNVMELSGFRESESGGIFGIWKGPKGSGDFRIKPTTDKENERKLQEERNKKVEQLVSMGFPKEWVEDALLKTEGDMNAAADRLAHRVAEVGGADGADDMLVTKLTDMGFSREVAEMALEACNNNVEQAVEFLSG